MSDQSDEEQLILSDNEAEEIQREIEAFAFERSKGKPPKEYHNDKPGLEQKLVDLKIKTSDGKDYPWEYFLDVTSDDRVNVKNVHDDLKRETSIYDITVLNVKSAVAKLEDLGIPYKRPEDYYAEMIKTDDHMLKLKDHLLAEKRRIDDKEKAAKERQMKKYSKRVQVETQLRREKAKAEDINVVKQWRKQQKNALNKDEEFPEELLDPKSAKRVAFTKPDNRNKKRKAKDEKYGYGGLKRHKKGNTSESSADLSGFSTARNKALPPGLKKKANRPGKQARKQGKR